MGWSGRESFRSLGTPVAGLFLLLAGLVLVFSCSVPPRCIFSNQPRTEVTGGGAVLSALIPLPESEKLKFRHCREACFECSIHKREYLCVIFTLWVFWPSSDMTGTWLTSISSVLRTKALTFLLARGTWVPGLLCHAPLLDALSGVSPCFLVNVVATRFVLVTSRVVNRL